MSVRVILSVEALEPRLSGIGRYSWELAQRLPLIEDIESVRFYRNGQWITDPGLLLTVDGLPLWGNKPLRWLRKRNQWAVRLKQELLGK